MLNRVALVRTDVSEELCASIIRVTRIGELGTLAGTSIRSMLRRNKFPPKRRFLQEPHGRNIPEDAILHEWTWLNLYSTYSTSPKERLVGNVFTTRIHNEPTNYSRGFLDKLVVSQMANKPPSSEFGSSLPLYPALKQTNYKYEYLMHATICYIFTFSA
jgi:hypothetical protein